MVSANAGPGPAHKEHVPACWSKNIGLTINYWTHHRSNFLGQKWLKQQTSITSNITNLLHNTHFGYRLFKQSLTITLSGGLAMQTPASHEAGQTDLFARQNSTWTVAAHAHFVSDN